MDRDQRDNTMLALAGNAACEYPHRYDNKIFHYDANSNIDYISYLQGGTEVFRHVITYSSGNPITWNITNVQ